MALRSHLSTRTCCFYNISVDCGRTFACSGYLLCGFGHTKHSSFSLLLSSISWQGRQWSGFLLHCNWAEAAHSFYPLTSAYRPPHHVSLAATLTYSDHSKLISDWNGLCLPLLHYGTCYVKGYSRNSKLTGYFSSCLAYKWPPSQAILWQAEGMWWGHSLPFQWGNYTVMSAQEGAQSQGFSIGPLAPVFISAVQLQCL